MSILIEMKGNSTIVTGVNKEEKIPMYRPDEVCIEYVSKNRYFFHCNVQSAELTDGTCSADGIKMIRDACIAMVGIE